MISYNYAVIGPIIRHTQSKKILSRWFWDVLILVLHDSPSGVLTAAPWMHKDRCISTQIHKSSHRFGSCVFSILFMCFPCERTHLGCQCHFPRLDPICVPSARKYLRWACDCRGIEKTWELDSDNIEWLVADFNIGNIPLEFRNKLDFVIFHNIWSC